MNRRGFFGIVLGAILGRKPIVEWAMNMTGLPFVPSPAQAAFFGDGTYGGIERATFSFWRSSGPLSHDPMMLERVRGQMLQAYNDCASGP